MIGVCVFCELAKLEAEPKLIMFSTDGIDSHDLI